MKYKLRQGIISQFVIGSKNDDSFEMDTVTPLVTPRETIQDSASQDSASILSYPINDVNVNSESVSELSGVSDSLSMASPNGINFGMTAHSVHTTDTCTCTTNSTRTSLATPSMPSDIATSTQESPVQPQNHSFPTSLFGDKSRAFSPSWYNNYPWLEYSIIKDAVFCYPCRFFIASHKFDNSFVTCGFCHWKNATGKGGKLERHNRPPHEPPIAY